MFPIYISTGGNQLLSGADYSKLLHSVGVDYVELSGGAVDLNQVIQLADLKKTINFQVHNYFPPPEVGFVFNLASENKQIHQQSVELAEEGIRLTVKLGGSVYSFHAGFRINPMVAELGNDLRVRHLQNRAATLNKFKETIYDLSRYAKSMGCDLLVENNVLTKNNYHIFGENPLLLVEPDEIQSFFTDMPQNVGLLLDVAHLKVSAKTLQFDLDDAHKQLRNLISAYHLSDNDGLTDSNMPVSIDSWFWKGLKRDVRFITLEIYKQDLQIIKSQLDLVRQNLISGIAFE